MNFATYAINPTLVKALNECGLKQTTDIQEKTLASSLRGESLLVRSETGSGKTHAYLIPLINSLNDKKTLQAIIIEPTLELCSQCQKFGEELASKINTFNITTNISENNNYLLPTILITTVGKLKELILVKKVLDISNVNILVLDEADMLLEGEAKDDTIAVVDKINAKQKLIFTATMKEHELASLKKLFNISNVIINSKKNYTSVNVSHHFVNIKHRKLDESLMIFLKTVNPYFTLVFASKKTEIQHIYKSLCNNDIKCVLLTSDNTLSERKNIIRRINDGEFNLVLCSDLASRGLDFEKVSHVISLDIPENIDYYYHRSGRTGRYKDKGDSYIFYDDDLNKKAKATLESKLKFDYLILRNEGLKADKVHEPMKKKKNDALEAEIKKEIAKVRSKKVKPNYKKKMRQAAEKAIKNHKRKIIMENLKSKRKAMAQVD